MRRTGKIKPIATRIPLRKAVTSSTAAARRHFPAWIDSGDRATPVIGSIVMPRVRDGLVLRAVPTKRNAKDQSSAAGGAR